MGDDIKSKIAKAFKHHSNRAFDRRLNTPDLFSSVPIILVRSYRCRAETGVTLQRGEIVAAVRSHKKVRVWCGNQIIGEPVAGELAAFLEIFDAEPRAERIALAQVTEEVGLDGCFDIELVEPPVKRNALIGSQKSYDK